MANLYGQLSELRLPLKKRERYRTLATRYVTGNVPVLPATGFPDYLRRPGAYQDVWRQDLIEWELNGDPAAVLARLVVERTDHVRFSRLALRALLLVASPGFSPDEVGGGAELALALGRIQIYEVLRPMERLFENSPAATVRAAVMAGVGQVYCRRSFGLIRHGLEDSAPSVREQALTALRGLKFRDGLESLIRIFREKDDEAVRLAALETIADIGSTEAGLFLLDAVLYETGAVQDTAERRLRGMNADDLGPALSQIAGAEAGTNPAIIRAMNAVGKAPLAAGTLVGGPGQVPG